MTNINAPLSDVAVMNMAVTTLDEAALTTPNDTSNLGRFMAREYGLARNELLRRYPWTFAKKRAVLAPLSEAPAFGFDYQYEAPADCLRLLPLRCGGKLNGEMIPYEYESRKILTNEGPTLYVRYIRYVTNATEFDPLFARALGQLLAMMAAQRVTGKIAYLDKARELYREALSDAFHVDALESGTPESYTDQDVISVRGGY